MRPVFCALELGRMLLGRQQRAVCLERFASQGLLVQERKKGEASIMAHVLHILIRHVGLWYVCIACTCGALSIAFLFSV